MKIGAIGYNHTHDADYYQDRPQGIGCWLFLHIRTPAIFRFGDREYNVKKGSAVLISQSTPCCYSGADGGYADDWIFFDTTDSVKSIAENMHMSCSGLQHLYKRLFGVNISSDIINARLARAKELLLSTGLTVDRVAEHCGYSCSTAFCASSRKNVAARRLSSEKSLCRTASCGGSYTTRMNETSKQIIN